MTGNLWESQERWRLKSNLYIGLIRNLQKMIGYWEDLHYIRTNYEAGSRAEADALDNLGHGEQARLDATRAVRDANAVAVIVNAKIAAALDAMDADTEELDIIFASEIADRVTAYPTAYEAIVAESREDLRVSVE